MKITLFTTGSACNDIGSFKIAHITMFDGKGIISLHFISDEEQMKCIKLFIKHYVLFKCQGSHISILPEENNFQRVRFRFDS